MQAAVYRGSQRVEVETVPVPEIGASEILIRVETCGICHTTDPQENLPYDLLEPPPAFMATETVAA